MRITYRVVDTRNNKDITEEYDWVLQPNGRLAYNLYGNIIVPMYAKAIFTLEEHD